MPHPEVTVVCLPCDQCATLVTIYSETPRAYIDQWLDGVHVVYCPDHR